MSGHREQLTQALRALRVTSQTSYAWFGRRSRPLPENLSAALPEGAAREYLVCLLERELYRSFFTQGRPVPTSLTRLGATPPNRRFVEALSVANTGVGGWESGWRVEGFEGSFLLVGRNGLRARVRAADCDRLPGGHALGASIAVRRPKELRSVSPGFYTALGDTEIPARLEEREVRVYFNVTPMGAAPLVAICTQHLNDAGLPFDLKVVDRPTGFARCDSAVLYLTDESYQYVRARLGTITSTCSRHLRGEVPTFTKPLARGVAVGAHRPDLGGSFGSSRCRLIADGLVEAYESGAHTILDRLDAVGRRFAVKGLDIEAPYRAPGSVDRCEL